MFGNKSKNGASRLNIVFKYLKPYRKEVALLSALSLASAFFNALTPLVAGNIVDALIDPNFAPFGYILPLTPAIFFLLIWFGLQAMMNLVDSILGYKNRVLDEQIFADYIVSSANHTIRLPMAFHKEKKLGDIQNRFQAAAQNLSTIVSNVMITLLPQFLSIIIALAVTIYIKPLLALMLVTSIIFYVLILVKVGPRHSKLRKKMWRAYNDAFGDAHDSLQNVHSVKQAGAERYEAKKLYRGFHLRAMKYMRKVLYMWQVMNSSQRILATLTQGAVYFAAIYYITQGTMTIGQLVMFNGYVALFLGPFVILMNNWNVVDNGLASLERAELIMLEKQENYSDNNAVILQDINGEVEFKNVNFTYGKKHKAVLGDISFSAKQGEVVALVGESGVGKTTVMELLGRYYDVTSGKITVDGHDIRNMNLQFLRSRIAVVPQEVLLFNDTIKENIRYGSFNATDKKIQKAALAAYADDFIQQFPKKYRQIVGERGVKLSTGQKQRIAIARAVLRDPKILILDEPTSALDANSEKLVEEALRELMKGRTTFVIAHRLSTVRHADKILVFKHGRIAEAGTHGELIKKPDGIYRRLYELQIGLEA